MNDKYVIVDSMVVQDNKVVFNLEYSKNIRNYFLTGRVFVEYDSDISDVEESILNISILSTVIPVAWGIGADIYIDKIDKTYLHSIHVIRDVFKKFYPKFSFSTSIHVKNVVSNEFDNKGVGLLFSSGLDSLTSYIRHEKERPELISIWGADIPCYERKFWEKVKKHICNFANQEKLTSHFIKTNMRDLLNEWVLTQKFVCV
jgi:hypothetical protein